METNNNAKLREAMKKIRSIITTEWWCGNESAVYVITRIENIVDDALAASARNCDVGTPAQ